MDYALIFWFIIYTSSIVPQFVHCQHEDIPYENVDKICDSCVCLTTQDSDKRYHYTLSCSMKNFKHILARWPEEFASNHNGNYLVATFSGNSITLLQQLPATNSWLSFSCQHCGIRDIQAPTFVDVPNLKRLDLSWNELTGDVLMPDVFRGPYKTTQYEPIALIVLDLSHNGIQSLDSKLFEHTPNLTKLNLACNKFTVLDSQTTLAISSAYLLELLDLSCNNLKTIPATIFSTLINLKALSLHGNEFKEIPDSLSLIGRYLEILNIANNPVESFSEESFLGLKVLKRLNISHMAALKSIDSGTFSRLKSLEYLFCARNPKLQIFDLDSLTHSSNLTYVDISYCGLSTLSLAMNFSQGVGSNATSPWRKLQTFEMIGNPWNCDCRLLQNLEFCGNLRTNTQTRCESPFVLAGALISNLTANLVCSMPVPGKYRVHEEDPPRFLRKRYIILTVFTAATVIILGLAIGFLIVCIRRKLKQVDFGIEPIRYTSVRSSNLSAVSATSAMA